jgi:hypothetical protein
LHTRGPVINYDVDILWLRIANFSDTNFRLYRSLAPQWLVAGVGGKHLLRHIKRLAFPSMCSSTQLLFEAIAKSDHPVVACEYAWWFWSLGLYVSEAGYDNPFLTIQRTCPALEEVVVVLRASPFGATIDDLYETPDTGAWTGEVQRKVAQILRHFEEAKTDGKWMNVKLKFMRIETWER